MWRGQAPGTQPLCVCWDNCFGGDSRACETPTLVYTQNAQAGAKQGMDVAS